MTSAPSGYASRHGRLHKRSDSGSSLVSTTSIASFPIKHDLMNHPSKAIASQKIKPYLRKMSMRDHDEEQGRIDLSRPSGDYDSSQRLCDMNDSDTDTSHPTHEAGFLPTIRRRSTHHRRATSLSSPLSTHATTLRPTQSFIHTTRHVSQPYAPPPAFSNTTFPNSEDEVEESADIITDDLRRTSIERWRSRRTVSSTSAPYASSMLPSQTYSAASLTKLTSTSQSNLSEQSANSVRSSHEIKPIHSRRSTGLSLDLSTTPSSRTSIDRAVGFLSRSPEPEDPAARAANIRALRRAFEEKEAAKARKLEKLEMKRRDTAEMKRSRKEDRDRRRSEADDRTHHQSSFEDKVNRRRSTNAVAEASPLDEKMAGTEYSRHSPVPTLSLPIQGGQGGAASETRVHTEVSKTKAAKSHWVRFRAWSKTRMLSCY
ncbi:hypothetical protein AAFC00_003528 [Neodothiora populina]|uniref:Uncharacterized protein n=1 Tax=Neodothiora populina TaxID=2781224 RepID=A0ABR3PEN9_9PEZI